MKYGGTFGNVGNVGILDTFVIDGVFGKNEGILDKTGNIGNLGTPVVVGMFDWEFVVIKLFDEEALDARHKNDCDPCCDCWHDMLLVDCNVVEILLIQLLLFVELIIFAT